MRTNLLLMVEWAKNLSPFSNLSMKDKIILLKNYAPQHLILMPAFRSPDTTRVCLFNNTYMDIIGEGKYFFFFCYFNNVKKKKIL